MRINDINIDLLNKLLGPMSGTTIQSFMQNIDCFFHPKVSLFIPSRGQCRYAISQRHSHPSYSFTYYFQPVCDFIIEGRNISYDLVEGKCLSVISPGIPHQEVKQEHFQTYISIMIDANLFTDTIVQYTNSIPVFRGEAYAPYPELLGVLRCFMVESYSRKDYHGELLNHLALVIAHLVARSVIKDTHKTVPVYERFEVDRAIGYMNRHFSEKISVEDLAEKVNLSAGHFSKIFKSTTGMTPMDFLQTARLQRARMMLLNSMKSITEIAIECGFSTSSYFSSCFLEKFKMTPSAFRGNFKQKKVKYYNFEKIPPNIESDFDFIHL